jgi:GT2 family glycosyltransferase
MIETVIIPVLNRYDLLERAVRSLGSVETLIVVDNGGKLCDDDLRDWSANGVIQNVGRVYVWPMPSNLGVATSWNLGIKATAHANGWLLLNSDAWFTDGAYEAFSADTEGAEVVQAGVPPWCCTWISAEAISRVGLFCERFYPAYMEDVDWQARAVNRGIDFRVSGAHVQHENSSTINSSDAYREGNRRTHRSNNAIFRDRWEGVSEDGVPGDAEWDLTIRLANSWV